MTAVMHYLCIYMHVQIIIQKVRKKKPDKFVGELFRIKIIKLLVLQKVRHLFFSSDCNSLSHKKKRQKTLEFEVKAISTSLTRV